MAEQTKTDAPVTQTVKTVTLTIDGRQVTVPKGTTVLEASLGMGIHIPYFCWHPKLKPVGACRMCYVEIEKFPKLQVSCATECSDGMVVHTDSDQVKQGRKAVLEFLLTNHPLDCPTCDKGGECDLQNMTFAHGHDDSRFEFLKRRHITDGVVSTFDDIRIGPEIMLNRNRCILCYKCVRANKEAFGEYDLGAFERGNHTEIHNAPGEQVANPFSGNLVEICPVGALTNSDWRYKIRVWLTKTAKSVDPFDASGSNTLLWKDPHKNHLYRTTSRRNDDIDDGWISDVVRYGYQIAQSPDRLQTPLMKKNGQQVAVTWEEALAVVGKRLKEVNDSKGNVCIGGLVGPQLDAATLYSMSKFMRTVIGSNNIDYRIDYRNLPKSSSSTYAVLASRPFKISDIDISDLIVVFGSDLTIEHPNEYLRMRKAFNFGGAKIYFANPYSTKAADIANLEYLYKPGTEEAFVNGLCLAAIDEKLANGDADLLLKKVAPATLVECAAMCGISAADLKFLARSIANGKKVTFIVGEQVSQSRDRDTISAALCNLNRLMDIEQRGQIAVLARYANSKGAERVGLLPEPHPNVKQELAAMWNEFPDASPQTTEEMFGQMVAGELDGFVIVGANPVMMYPDRQYVQEALEKLDFLVVADLFETETTAMADVVLPLSSWMECAGEYVNLEGRVQWSEQAIKPVFASKPGHEVVSLIAGSMGQKLFSSDSQRESELRRLLSTDITLSWPSGWLEARPANGTEDKDYPLALVIGDEPHHRSYLTEKASSLLNFCAEAYVELSPELADSLDVAEGDPVKVESKTGKMVLPVKISRHLEGAVVFVPRNFSPAKVNVLVNRKARVDRVRLTKAAD